MLYYLRLFLTKSTSIKKSIIVAAQQQPVNQILLFCTACSMNTIEFKKLVSGQQHDHRKWTSLSGKGAHLTGNHACDDFVGACELEAAAVVKELQGVLLYGCCVTAAKHAQKLII